MTRAALRQLLFSQTGRTRRWDFFMVMPPLLVFAAFVYLGITEIMLASYGLTMLSSRAGRSMIAGEIAGAAALLTLAIFAMPLGALLTKRLHDANLSGLWLVAVAVPIVANACGLTFGLNGTSEMPTALGELLVRSAVVAALALIPLSLWPGTPGPNAFGLDPRTPEGTGPQ